jgi:hypothetical protein
MKDKGGGNIPTPDWALKYRKDYRTYSKGWFVALILLIPAGLVIGALASGKYTWKEGLGSGLFFAVILFLLMRNMFKGMDKAWRGRVVSKSAQEVYRTRKVGRRKKRVFQGMAYGIEVRTEAGRKEYVEIHQAVYPLFQEGDEVVKYKGIPFVDRTPRPGETHRMCLICGNAVDVGAAECPHCRFKFPSDLQSR